MPTFTSTYQDSNSSSYLPFRAHTVRLRSIFLMQIQADLWFIPCLLTSATSYLLDPLYFSLRIIFLHFQTCYLYPTLKRFSIYSLPQVTIFLVEISQIFQHASTATHFFFLLAIHRYLAFISIT